MDTKQRKIIKYSLIFVILLLIAIRLFLPYLALKYVTFNINKNTEYRAKIADLNLDLLQGKATIIHIRLWKKNIKISDPLVTVDKVSFSIHWHALLKGKLVGKTNIQHPIITILDTADSQTRKQQIQISKQSINLFKSLMPLDLNLTTVHDGEVYFKSNTSEKSPNLNIKNINITLENLQNISRQNGLVSSFSVNAKAMDSGDLSIIGKFDPSTKIATFYVKASLKNLHLPKMNHFLKKYTDIKTKEGVFSLFFEAAAADGMIHGYAKPFLKNLKIETEKDASLGQKIYEGVVSLGYKILKNAEQKSTATQINISGKVDDPNISIFSIIGYLLHHALIEALLPSVDNKISMKDVVYSEEKHHH